MKSKKIMHLIVVIMVISFSAVILTGCQLAKETGSMNANGERLCGVFVTFDSEASKWKEQNIENVEFNINKKGEVVFKDGNGFSSTNSKIEGVVSKDGGPITFDGIKGYYMGEVQIEDEKGQKNSTSLAEQGFHDVKFAFNIMDEQEESNSEGTLSVGPDFRDIININPVYQREDGTYYTMIGQGMGFMISGESSGQIYSQTLDNSMTQTINGKTSLQKTSYKVNVAVADEAEQIFIKEMNQNDELIKTTEYLRDDLDKFIVDSKTKYVIVEELMNNVLEGNYVKRSIYGLQQNLYDSHVLHTCNFSGDNGVMGLKTVQFVYE